MKETNNYMYIHIIKNENEKKNEAENTFKSTCYFSCIVSKRFIYAFMYFTLLN